MKRTLAAGLALSLLLPAAAHAQSAQRFSVQVSGIANVLFGDPSTEAGLFFGAPKSGYGGEVQLRYTPTAFSLGAGFQMAVHQSEEPPDSPWDFQEASQDFTLTGIFIEPRYVARATSDWALYVSGRFSFSSIEWESQGTGYLCDDGACNSTSAYPFNDTGEATGYTVNAGGGLLFRLTDRVNLDVGGTVGLKSFGDLSVTLRDGPGTGRTQQTGTLGNFGNTVLRVGLAVGLGG